MFAVGQALRIPNRLYLLFQSPGEISSAGMAKRTTPQGIQKEGALEADIRWVGTPLPGSLNISQPVDSVFLLEQWWCLSFL